MKSVSVLCKESKALEGWIISLNMKFSRTLYEWLILPRVARAFGKVSLHQSEREDVGYFDMVTSFLKHARLETLRRRHTGSKFSVPVMRRNWITDCTSSSRWRRHIYCFCVVSTTSQFIAKFLVLFVIYRFFSYDTWWRTFLAFTVKRFLRRNSTMNIPEAEKYASTSR